MSSFGVPVKIFVRFFSPLIYCILLYYEFILCIHIFAFHSPLILSVIILFEFNKYGNIERLSFNVQLSQHVQMWTSDAWRNSEHSISRFICSVSFFPHQFSIFVLCLHPSHFIYKIFSSFLVWVILISLWNCICCSVAQT